MDNNNNALMENLFISLGFSLSKIQFKSECCANEMDVYFAHKKNSDYFIYTELQREDLSNVNNQIQIELSFLFENEIDRAKKIAGDDIEISPSFKKNATLIVFTNHDSNSFSEVSKLVMSIEEDPYYFKKQVLSTNVEDQQRLRECLNKENMANLVQYLQLLISDTNKFNEFIEAKASGEEQKVAEYSFVAKLYEKLPFLELPVKKHQAEDLQKSINEKLSEQQLLLSKNLIELDLSDLDIWVKEMLEEDSNA